jgi:hypothetical protein
MLIAWTLLLLNYLQPVAPWSKTYPETAQGMVEGATAVPVFDGPLGVERTVALDASLAWFESRFDVHATGDHGTAHGLYQVHAPEGETVKEQTIQANRMVKQSFKACANQRTEEWLGWYAAGGNDCMRGLRESRHRMLKAFWLFKHFPPPSIP